MRFFRIRISKKLYKMKLKIIKAHGSQNEFFIVDARKSNIFTETFRRELAIALCNRTNWLNGADGIVFIDKGLNTTYQMRIFNADGSEALMCGNGMRVMARWVLELERAKELTIENVTNLQYQIKPIDIYFKDVKAVALQMPPAILNSVGIIEHTAGEWINKSIPDFYSDMKFTVVAMPNPHIVTAVESLDMALLEAIGKAANENKAIFPQGVNVSFAQYINENEIFVATYERGVGLTNACGTAMIASTVTGILLEKLQKNQQVKVKNPGGFIQVTVYDDWSCEMIGNATYTAEIVLDIDEEDPSLFTITSDTLVTDEIDAYDQLLKQLDQ